jgi:hypothetical protein
VRLYRPELQVRVRSLQAYIQKVGQLPFPLIDAGMGKWGTGLKTSDALSIARAQELLPNQIENECVLEYLEPLMIYTISITDQY